MKSLYSCGSPLMCKNEITVNALKSVSAIYWQFSTANWLSVKRGVGVYLLFDGVSVFEKTESTRKLSMSNFNFQWTKTLYQNNFGIFQGLKIYLVICNNTKEKNSLWEPDRENECHISQNCIIHMGFSEVYLCFHNSCQIWH